MLSTSEKKFVRSLKQKKYRQQYGCFVVEGNKIVEELLNSDFEIINIYATPEWIANHSCKKNVIKVSQQELLTISSLKTPCEVLAVVKKKIFSFDSLPELSISLDNIQDPGNMGTIIRTADWFGIQTIICSLSCVEIFNPKVVQATMGSLFRVDIVYIDLVDFFSKNASLKIYGALLDGDNVYKKRLIAKNSILLIGNESKGISTELIPFITEKIKIPSFGIAESLNAATATAIFCSEFKRHC